MRTGLGGERPNVPNLNLTRRDTVRASPSIVAVIVDIDVVAGCGRVPNVLHGRNDIELFT
jgi:hypothetical protein